MTRTAHKWVSSSPKKRNRKQMASIYAQLIMARIEYDMNPNFPRVNKKIIALWSMSGLRYIKRLAWKELMR